MEHLDPPAPELWDERRLWFEAEQARLAEAGASRVSEQAAALMVDLQAVFCAGAWAAALLLAASVVEAQLRGGKGGGVDWRGDRDLAWLRRRRNALIHETPSGPGLTIEDHWTRRDQWEAAARRACRLAMAVLYDRPRHGTDQPP